MTKPPKKPKAAPTYEEMLGAIDELHRWTAGEDRGPPDWLIEEFKEAFIRFVANRFQPAD